MLGSRCNALLLLAALVSAATNSTRSIVWGSCDDIPKSETIRCASLPVPLDYSDPGSNKTVTLQLAQYPAVVQPSKGTILMNFGGPGNDGRTSLLGNGPIYQILTGGLYDLVAFDPRGTAKTVPFDCFSPEEQTEKFIWGNGSLTLSSNDSEVALGEVWEQSEMYATRCQNFLGSKLGLYGSAFVARDLISTVDALGEDGLLRYWGVSYGTSLGAIAAAMFPDKIDRMVLDAVQNAHEYYNSLADFQEWEDSDKLFSAIFTTCYEAGPERCPISRRFGTGAELETAVFAMLDRLKAHPLVHTSADGKQQLLSYGLVKGFCQTSLYTMDEWPVLMGLFDSMLDNKTDGADKLLKALTGLAPIAQPLVGIRCGDKTVRAASIEEFSPVRERLFAISNVMGDSSVSLQASCAQWKGTSKELYRGDFQVKTKHPILLLSNTLDGHTPLVSAKNMSAGFEGSTVLEVQGYGHGTGANPSLCTLQHSIDYWATGVLPAPGTKCPIDVKPYTMPAVALKWLDLAKQMAGGNQTEGSASNTTTRRRTV